MLGAAPVAARGVALTQPSGSRCLAGWLSSKLGTFRQIFSPLCCRSAFLRFHRSDEVSVGWRHVFSWALMLLHSVKLLWRWRTCPVRLLYMSSRFKGCNGPGQEVWRRQSLSLRPHDGIVGWYLRLVPPGFVDLVLVCKFVLVILGVVSVL